MKLGNASALIRKCFSAWETKDKAALEVLLAEDFTYTSPNNDDHISQDEYWKECWPGSEKIRAIRIDKLFERGDEAFVRYECELKDGARFRNTEYFRIEGSKIKEVEVYFGSPVKYMPLIYVDQDLPDRKILITDGPFAETREHVGG